MEFWLKAGLTVRVNHVPISSLCFSLRLCAINCSFQVYSPLGGVQGWVPSHD